MKRMIWLLIVAIVTMNLIVSGCSRPREKDDEDDIIVPPDGNHFSGSMLHEGLNRTYVGYIPSRLDENTDYPLVVALHGTSSDGAGMIATAHLVSKSSLAKFIVVAPDGLQHNLTTFFNAGEGYENLTDTDGDGNGTNDTGFISRLIDDMIANYSVDPSRVYLMGHSNGGMTAYRLAVEIPHKIAAIASNSGPMVYEYDPIAPVPIIHMHGLEDDKVEYDGGPIPGGDVISPPVEEVMETWRVANGCDANATQFYNDTTNETYGNITGRNWTSAEGKHDVVLYTFEKGKHGWRNQDNGLAATDVFWDFLKRHSIAS